MKEIKMSINALVEESLLTARDTVVENEKFLQIAAVGGTYGEELTPSQFSEMLRRAVAMRLVLTHARWVVVAPHLPATQAFVRQCARWFDYGIVRAERDAMRRAHELPEVWRSVHEKKLEEYLTHQPLLAAMVVTYPYLLPVVQEHVLEVLLGLLRDRTN